MSPETEGGLPPGAETRRAPKEPDMKNEAERRLTTPEEASEMTRQRRREYGLEESSDLTPEKLQEIETAIGELRERLSGYDYDSLSPEAQDAMYWVEQEANAGKDRELAKAVLARFISTLTPS